MRIKTACLPFLMIVVMCGATVSAAATDRDSWTWENTGDLAGALRVYALAESGGSLFAGSGPTGNVYRSDDFGASWANTANLADASQAYALLEGSDGAIYAGTKGPDGSVLGRVFRTIDGGLVWTDTAELVGADVVFALTELSGGVMLAGTSPAIPNANLPWARSDQAIGVSGKASCSRARHSS